MVEIAEISEASKLEDDEALESEVDAEGEDALVSDAAADATSCFCC